MEEEIKKLKSDAYRIKFTVEEQDIIYKDAFDEVEKIKQKIKRAKDLNQQMQKVVRRTRKTKSKLEEEVKRMGFISLKPIYFIIYLLFQHYRLTLKLFSFVNSPSLLKAPWSALRRQMQNLETV